MSAMPRDLEDEPMTLDAIEIEIAKGSENMPAAEFDAWLDPIMKSLVGYSEAVRSAMLHKIKAQTKVNTGALNTTLQGYVRQAKRKKANSTRTVPACKHTFESGGHVELARVALFDLHASSDAGIKYVNGLFWRYLQSTGKWAPVNGHDGNDEVARLVQSYDGAELSASKVNLSLDHGDVEGAVKQAARMAGDTLFFDEARRGIVVANGFLTMDTARDPKHRPRTPVLVPHSPENRARSSLAIAYDPSARAPRFEKFLEECLLPDPRTIGDGAKIGDADLFVGYSLDQYGLISMLQEFCGAAVFGFAPQYARAAIFKGIGHNGKTTFLCIFTGTETQAGLFPRELQDAIPPQKFEDPYFRASLDGKLVNIVNEMPDNELANSAGFKSIIDGTVVKARNPYERPFDFRPRAAHFFAVNMLPPSNDQTLGYKRRWLLFPFLKSFEGKRDEGGLADRIIRDELPGILNWCIEGAQRLLLNDAYTIPHVAQKAADEWHSSNAIGMWFSEHKSTRPQGPISLVKYAREQLHQEFMLWAEKHGFQLMNAATFSNKVHALGYEQKKTEDGIPYFVMPEMASIVPLGLEEIVAARRRMPRLRAL